MIESTLHTLRLIKMQHERASQSSMLALLDTEGRPLYKVTSSGNIRRTMKVPPHVKREVRERDADTCQECGATGVALDVAHIVAYRNCGPNTADNLRLLCRPCHITEGVN